MPQCSLALKFLFLDELLHAAIMNTQLCEFKKLLNAALQFCKVRFYGTRVCRIAALQFSKIIYCGTLIS